MTSLLKHIYSHLGLDRKVRQLRHKCTIMLLITTIHQVCASEIVKKPI